MRLSIRYKILAVTGLLLLLAVGFYTLLASYIFVEQKTTLLYEINHSVAVNSAAQIRTALEQFGDRAKLYSISQLISGNSGLRLPARGLKDGHILSLALYKKSDNRFEQIQFGPDFPTSPLSIQEAAPALAQAIAMGQAFWRPPQAGTHSAFFLATKLELEIGKAKQTYVTLAEIEARTFIEPLLSVGLFESYLTDSKGQVWLHLRDQKENSLASIGAHPLVAQKKSERGSGVLAYEYEGEKRYGAYAPVGAADLLFITQAEQSEVISALAVLLQRSWLFALIVLTVTFIASVLFSKSLTENLSRLTQGAEAIGAGHLDAHIEVRSRDEVGVLAATFNQMMSALRTSKEAIEKYNHELEEKVALRTQQLSETNATIKSVQEKLLQASQLAAVGEVAGRTAHELLNPLTAILSRIERSRLSVGTNGAAAEMSLPLQLAEILNAWKQDYRQGGISGLTQNLTKASSLAPGKTLLDEDLENLEKIAHYWQNQNQVVSGDLDFVRDQAERIHRIVDGMRELVRSSVQSEVTCRSAVLEASATMADFLAQHGVQFQTQWHASNDLAFLNRDELIQIVTNLLRNSYQAIQETGRGGTINLTGRNEGKTLIVEVTDNGAGISSTNQTKLFDQGFTTKGPSEGTGLGLAICRRYARAFGGEVELVFSDPARGTCFRLTIPLKVQEAVA